MSSAAATLIGEMKTLSPDEPAKRFANRRSPKRLPAEASAPALPPAGGIAASHEAAAGAAARACGPILKLTASMAATARHRKEITVHLRIRPLTTYNVRALHP